MYLGKRSLRHINRLPTTFFHVKRSSSIPAQASFEPPPSYISPHTDPRIPTAAMVVALLKASTSESHQHVFDAIVKGNATESDYAAIGQAIISCRQGKQEYPPIFYVQVAKKTLNSYVTSDTIIHLTNSFILLHSIHHIFVRWFSKWRKEKARQVETYFGPFTTEGLEFLKNAACEYHDTIRCDV